MAVSNAQRWAKKIIRLTGRAVSDFNLIEANDRILVAVSGGKDSLTMVEMLKRLRRSAPIHFDLIAFHLDQCQPGFPIETVRDYLESCGIEAIVHRSDTYTLVKERLGPEETACTLCSRYRRGILYRRARELGCNKIALGHHRDDAVETFLLNIFHRGRLQTMPARLLGDGGRVTVIRPLLYVPEEWIEEFSRAAGLPAVACSFCNNQPNLRRPFVKGLLAELSRDHPEIPGNIFAALGRVIPSHLLDRDLLALLSQSPPDIDMDSDMDMDSDSAGERCRDGVSSNL